MVAEMVPEKELQPRAFSIMPLVWSIGMLHNVIPRAMMTYASQEVFSVLLLVASLPVPPTSILGFLETLSSLRNTPLRCQIL
jgi:hypothetical protein